MTIQNAPLTDNNIQQTTSLPPDPSPWPDWTRRIISIVLVIVVVFGLSVAGPIYGQVVLAVALCLFLFTPIRALFRHTRLSYASTVLIVLASTLPFC